MLLLLLRAGVWRIMDGLVHCGRIIIFMSFRETSWLFIVQYIHSQSTISINQSIPLMQPTQRLYPYQQPSKTRLLALPGLTLLHQPHNLRPPAVHLPLLLIARPPALLERRKPLLACAVLLVRRRMRNHTRVHRQPLLPTDPGSCDGAVDGAFGEGCMGCQQRRNNSGKSEYL